MANNNIQSTHEKIHSGLSGLNNDEKWKDMLNFRSAQSKTTVVPHKYLWFSAGCAGLQSLIAGLSGHALAIGKHQSFGFIGADKVNAYPLWRMRQRYLGALSGRAEQSQRLVVQGSYTGDKPMKLRVHYVAGKLQPFWQSTPVTPPSEPWVAPDFGCDGDSVGSDSAGYFTIKFLIRNHDLTVDDAIEYLKDVKIYASRISSDSQDSTTDAFGRARLTGVRSGFYSFSLTKAGFEPKTVSVQITGEVTLEYDLTEITPDWEDLGRSFTAGTLVRLTDDDYLNFVDYISEGGWASTDGDPHYLFLTDFTIDNEDYFYIYDIPDENARSVNAWSVGVPDVNSYWMRNHSIYRCLDSQGSSNLNAENHPGTGANWRDYWERISTGRTYTDLPLYIAADKYYPGTKVKHAGARYRCLYEHYPLQHPIPEVPTNWELLP